MSPLEPAECAAMARRAAALVDPATLPTDGGGASFVLWQDEESVAWLNVVRKAGTPATTTTTAPPSACTCSRAA